jgi:16S rRNA processing protein RimM
MTVPRYIALGRVVGAHGLRGEIRVRYFEGGPDELLRLERLVLGESEDDSEALAYDVGSASVGRGREVRLALVGVDGRDAAEQLRGRLVMADPDRLEVLPEGEYYGYQFIGCRVEAEDGSEIGIVRGIWPIGENDLLVVEGEGGVEHLIPVVRDLLREVDIEGRRIVVEVIPGLLDTA